MTTNDVHIGEIIKDIVKQKKLTDDEFAAMVAMSRQGVRYIYDKKSIHIDQLNMISKAINHNFFKYYAIAEEDKEQATLQEPPIVYRVPKKDPITVMVDLDGTEEKIKSWFDKLRRINTMVAASNAT